MKMIKIIFAAIVLFSLAGYSFGNEPVSKISNETLSRVESEWKKIDKSAPNFVWQYRVSLPFPAKWPDKNVEYYYIYATGNDVKSTISDGEVIAAPWARIDVSSEGQKLTNLSNQLKDIGIQGVRPLAANELKNAQKPGEEFQKNYYCSWIKTNGVIANRIKPSHEAFFKWLECK